MIYKNIGVSMGNKALSIATVLCLLSTQVLANELVGVQAKDGNNGTVDIFFTFSDRVKSKPTIVVLEKPSSITIDFEGVKNNLTSGDGKRITTINPKLISKDIKNLRIIENRKRLRIILYTNSKLRYIQTSTAKGINLKLSRATAEQGFGRQPFLSKVDFRRSKNGGGKILLKINGGTTTINPRTEGGSIVVDLNNTTTSKSIIKHYDVTDFNTAITGFDVYPIKGNKSTRIIVLTENDNVDYVAYQRNDNVVIEVKPLSPAKILQKKNSVKNYQGQNISLNFNNIEIRTALNIISEVSQLDFIISDSVSGQLSLSLNDIPWDEALDVILKTKNLAKRLDGRILRIGTLSEFAAQDKIELESRRVTKELAPIRSEYIQINYAKASDISKILSDGGEKAGFLSERGTVIVDDRTNAILVRDTAENLAEIRSFIIRLDIPIKQVLIESRIVVARDTFADEIGARFGISGVSGVNQNVAAGGNLLPGDTVVFSDRVQNSGQSLDNLVNTRSEILNAEPGDEITAPEIVRGLNFSNPAAGAIGGSFGLSYLVRSTILELELSAMQMEERGEVISSPRVITVERKQASIQQGVDIPYQESSGSGASTTSFKRASLGMTVTPQITPDNKVIMDLTVQRDSPGAAGANGVPNIDTREVTTQVIVPNGDTVILGGIFEQEKRKSRSKVPLFGDIPILGALFRRDTQSNNKNELLIFVTPKIINSSVSP